MSKSEPSSSKPPSAQTPSEPGVVTRFEARRRNQNEEPARFSARLDPASRALLDKLKVTIEQLPTLDATRVVQLHQRILAETYDVDADRLADKMLALEKSLQRLDR